jgi:hypothetical protein
VKNKLSVCKSIVDPKETRMVGNIDFCESLVGSNNTSKAEVRHRYTSAIDDQ